MSSAPQNLSDSNQLTPVYVGCDPGSTGAIAVILDNRVTVFDIPLSANPVGGSVIDDNAMITLALFLATLGPLVFVLEHNWGRKGQGGASQYKFGDTSAAIRVAFVAAGARLVRVSSQKWTAGHRVGSDKARHVARALKLYPPDAPLFTPRRLHITQAMAEGRADATLIADYGKRRGL